VNSESIHESRVTSHFWDMSKKESDVEYTYKPAWWLPNAHAQTLWGKLARRAPKVETTMECVVAPDGDNIELHHVAAPMYAPHVLLLHGLEGSPRSHYVGGILSQAKAREWGATLLVFRGCGSTANVAKRFYHSGETSDLDFVFAHLRTRWPDVQWFLTGVSLGGNVLLKWLGERGDAIAGRIRAAAAVSVPYDLEAGSRHISRGFARIYDRNFVRSLRRKARAKLSTYPTLFDPVKLERARTIYDFDDIVTGPVHGFADAHDYYAKSSSLGFLSAVRVKTLLLSAADDPFMPSEVLSRVARASSSNPDVTVEFHRSGGHVGFVGGARPWRPFYYAEWRVFRFFDEAMEPSSRKGYD
jgi:predicted alpha/beta-fold hydrolase